ncbi:MAG: hypothetical protein M3436_18070 [Pseudomonadota bacterium]|nr:hypothetical protein [Pseudomonadota bacterium]
MTKTNLKWTDLEWFEWADGREMAGRSLATGERERLILTRKGSWGIERKSDQKGARSTWKDVEWPEAIAWLTLNGHLNGRVVPKEWITGGGPDSCMNAVGLWAHGTLKYIRVKATGRS